MTSYTNDQSGKRHQALVEILHTMPGNDCATQCARMLAAMEQLGRVTSYEGSRFLDCYDPRARIHELRQAGAKIITSMCLTQTESGVFHRVGIYALDGQRSFMF
jgi:hypothetical protein